MNAQDVKTVTLVINSDQAKKKLDALVQQLDQARKKRQEAFDKGDAKGIEVYTREAAKLERQINRVQSRAQTVEKVLRSLDHATPDELKKTIKEINKELNSGNVERGSREWNSLTEAMGRASAELKKIREEQNAASRGLSEGASNFGSKWVGLVTVAGKVKDGFMEAMNAMEGYVNEYAEMAEHEANVAKYTGLAKEEVDKLNESFKKMDTRTPREKLNDLASDAGRLGIQSREGVQDFVEAADQINTALGEDLGEDAVKNIGKLTQMFGTDKEMGLKQGMLSTASVINELAQSSSASEGYIMEFTNRLAGVGNQAGMTQAQLMGLASVMDQNQVAVEKGATALQNVLTAIFRDPAKMAKAAGLEVEEFARKLKEDANAALLEFLQALQQSGGMDKLAPLLDEMNLSGAGVTQTISTLSAKLADVKAAQEQANAAFEAGTSCTDEAVKSNHSIQAELEKSQQRIANLRQELGKRLLPAYTAGTQALLTMWEALVWIADAIKTAISFTTENARAITTATMAVMTFTVALKAQLLWTKACTLATTAWTAAKTAWTAMTTAATAAQTAFNAAVKSNGFTAIISLILSAVAALGTWLFMTDKATDATKKNTDATSGNGKALDEQKKLLDAVSRARKAAADNTEKERARIEQLNATLHDGNARYADRRAALDAIRQIIPRYHAQLTAEGRLERDNVDAIREYIQALDDKATAEALFDELVEQKKKNRQLKKTLDTKQNNVNLVNNQLDNNWTLAPATIPEDSPYRSAGSGNKKRDAKLKELRQQEQARDDAQAKYNEGLQEEAKLKQELNKPNLRKYAAQENTVPTASDFGNASTDSGTSSNPKNVPVSDPVKKQSEQLQRQAEANKLAARAQYDAGIIEHKEYAEQMLIIDEELYEAQRNLYKEGTPEWVQLEQKRLDAVEAERKQYNAWSIADIDRQEQEELENVRANYAHGLINEEQYQHALSDTKLKYLKQRADMSHDWGQTDDAEKYQQQYDEASEEEQIQRQNAFWQKVDSFRQEYVKQSAEEQKRTELAFADELYKQQLLSEEEYQKAKQEIEEKYAEKPTDLGRPSDAMSQSVIGAAEALKNLHDKLEDGKAQWQDYAAVGMAAMQTVMATMQSVSQLMQANMALEEAKVTKRYDAEIEAAGSSTAKGKKLEEQKQKELAKIKTKYNKKQMAIEVAQAIAQTAMNAISAYGSVVKIPIVGPALAVAAAAAATAAGMIQIATIKKQHAAEAAGYYEGGFTGGSSYRRTAGVVHEGEFVANHQAVNNPNVLPVLQLIDHAQRTNRIASLTAADVSRAIAAPMTTASNTSSAAMAQPMVQVVDTSSKATADTLSRLNDRLDEGIRATVVIDGPDGLDRQWTKYNRMKNQ